MDYKDLLKKYIKLMLSVSVNFTKAEWQEIIKLQDEINKEKPK